ncbi:MAG: PTS transporter subunit EIIC [Actinobacteria bacterium]|nr:PTS transporter subunit EIIC [Actinomycetota bacterium]MDQ3531539.1 PTS transporter subunit EIIC [Actinomycetota bacterium]
MLAVAQRIGRSLMMPIAVLPAAALLLRLGAYFQEVSWLAWGNTVWQVMEAGGNGVFQNLPLIFAIGVAIGFTEGAGAAGLAAGVGYVVLKAINDISEVSEGVPVDMGVLGGILIGLVAAVLYTRYKGIRLPDYLAFFGGRRFVPIVTAFAALGIGLVAYFVWPPIGRTIDGFGDWIVGAGALGVFIYGIANRALLPVGLHHILNTLVWFEFGTFKPPGGGAAVHGDLTRFFAGDPEAGIFMAGWYFVMMFGLPAACFAMYRAADADNKQSTKAIMGSSGFTSFLTGITEPIEFSFLFLAPMLYAVHALLCGVALVVAEVLGIRHGFGFSAGLIDYLVAFGAATNPLLIIPIGLIFAAVYFALFSTAIRVFDLSTPGREGRGEKAPQGAASAEPAPA